MLNLQIDTETAFISKAKLNLPGGLNEDETLFALASQIKF